MKNLGYTTISKSFLVKNFNNIEINITYRNNSIESVIGYQNNDMINIPEEIINEVKSDINQSL